MFSRSPKTFRQLFAFSTTLTLLLVALSRRRRSQPAADCGQYIDFELLVEPNDGAGEPITLTFSVPTGQVSETAGGATVGYTGPPVAIPDNNVAGVGVPIDVSGLSGTISDLNFRIDGSSCTSAVGATTVGIDHTYVGDLVIKLTSPEGTTVTLIDQAGGSGNNFCGVLLDDQGGGKPVSFLGVVRGTVHGDAHALQSARGL